MGRLTSRIVPGDWNSVAHAIARLDAKLNTDSSPIFSGLGLTGLTENALMYADSDGVLTSLSAATNGQLIIGGTGATPSVATLTGTANEITVTNEAGSITLSLHSNITGHLHDGHTLQHDAVNSDGGAFSFNTTGDVIFNQPIITPAAIPATDDSDDLGLVEESAPSFTLEIDQPNGTSESYVSTSIFNGQTFTPDAPYSLARVGFKLKNSNSIAGNITLHLSDTDGAGEPTGPDLTSVVIDGLTITTSYDWVYFDLATPYSLDQGTLYAVWLSSTVGINVYKIYYPASDVYADGTRVIYTGGSWHEAPTEEMVFRVYSEAATIYTYTRWQNLYLSGSLHDGTVSLSVANAKAAYDFTTTLNAATDGQLMIGDTGNNPVLATLTGTADQIIVTGGAGSITLSTPQDIHTGASPTFANLSLGTGELTAGSINRAADTLTLEIAGTPELSVSTDLVAIANGLTVDDTTLVVDAVNHRVGIKTATPVTTLQIIGTTSDDIVKSDIGFDINAVETAAAFVMDIALIEIAGNVEAGTHYYYVSYYTDLGETGLSSTSNPAFITADATHEQVAITNIPISSDHRVIGRRIYRNNAGDAAQENVKLLVDLADNTTTTYTDNKSDAELIGNNAFWKENTTTDWLTVAGIPVFMAGFGSREPSTILGTGAGATIFAGTAIGGANTLIGFRTGRLITTGNKLIAIGYNALERITTAAGSIGIGWAAGGKATTGTDNVNIGLTAGWQNVTGSRNTLVGYQAGRGVSGNSNSNNVMIGNQTGRDVTTSSDNVLVGTMSGFSKTTGSGNIFLGFKSGFNQTSNSNLLIIDNQDRGSEANELTDSLIYGIFDATPANQSLRINGEILGFFGAKLGDGTNETQFSATGVQTMLGDARVIKHLHFTMELGKGQNAPAERFTENPYVSYTYGIGDDSHLSREAPDDMDYTVDSIIKIHWYTTDAGANGDGDEVRWEAQWASRAVGEDITAGDTTDNSGDIVCSIQNIIVETAVETIPANSIAVGDMIGIHLERVVLGDGAGPQVGTVHVVDVELEYTSNRLGEAI